MKLFRDGSGRTRATMADEKSFLDVRVMRCFPQSIPDRFWAVAYSDNRVIGVVGARTENLLILRDEMAAATDELHICTDDGSCGHHGFVTDIVDSLLPAENPALVVAIGPVPMMKSVCERTRTAGVKTLVSLNPIMIDGTGMCGGCRVNVGGTNKFACVDGPEFDGHAVDFDELAQRLRAYQAAEQESNQQD